MIYSKIENCHITSKDESFILVKGRRTVGGFAGILSESIISKSGVSSGMIISDFQAGGISATVILKGNKFEEIYVKNKVHIKSMRFAGGLIGELMIKKDTNNKIENCYSR
jgi:hypothetical protein